MRCIGGATRQSDFYFFTVETMFAIGFGSPRFPSCPAADWWVMCPVTMLTLVLAFVQFVYTYVRMVTPITVLTTIFNSLVVGLLFAKFSGSHDNREPIVFSDKIVGKCFNAKKVCNLTLLATDEKDFDNFSFFLFFTRKKYYRTMHLLINHRLAWRSVLT